MRSITLEAEHKETGQVFEVAQALFTEDELFKFERFCADDCHYGPFRSSSHGWVIDVGWQDPGMPSPLLFLRLKESDWLIRPKNMDRSKPIRLQALGSQSFYDTYRLLNLPQHLNQPS